MNIKSKTLLLTLALQSMSVLASTDLCLKHSKWSIKSHDMLCEITRCCAHIHFPPASTCCKGNLRYKPHSESVVGSLCSLPCAIICCPISCVCTCGKTAVILMGQSGFCHDCMGGIFESYCGIPEEIFTCEDLTLFPCLDGNRFETYNDEHDCLCDHRHHKKRNKNIEEAFEKAKYRRDRFPQPQKMQL